MKTSTQFDHIPLGSSQNDIVLQTNIKEKLGTHISYSMEIFFENEVR
jgi:hypothetical protein